MQSYQKSGEIYQFCVNFYLLIFLHTKGFTPTSQIDQRL